MLLCPDDETLPDVQAGPVPIPWSDTMKAMSERISQAGLDQQPEVDVPLSTPSLERRWLRPKALATLRRR
jgi:hypothetical protein